MARVGLHRAAPGSRAGSGRGAATVGAVVSRRGLALLVAVVALLTAVVLIGAYFAQGAAPPAPAAAMGAIPAPTRPAPTRLPAPVTTVPPSAVVADLPPTPVAAPNPPPPFRLPPSAPVSVRSNDVGIRSDLLRVGLNDDGTIEVPTSYSQAAWYTLGPTPGDLGPAVILGHVDSTRGPGVFFNLGAMKPGQTIDVGRVDGSTAHFAVDAIASYPKDQFPTEAVYGPITYAGLRLITCGGQFDKKTGNYENNTVVFASLVHP